MEVVQPRVLLHHLDRERENGGVGEDLLDQVHIAQRGVGGGTGGVGVGGCGVFVVEGFVGGGATV